MNENYITMLKELETIQQEGENLYNTLRIYEDSLINLISKSVDLIPNEENAIESLRQKCNKVSVFCCDFKLLELVLEGTQNYLNAKSKGK